jgi:Tfp pilus assembly protein PilF
MFGIIIGVAGAFPVAQRLLRRPEAPPVPENVRRNSMIDLSQRLLRAGDAERALPVLLQADSIGFKNELVQNNLCVAFNMLRRYEEAMEACRIALVLKPDFVLAQNNLQWARSHLPQGGKPAVP